MVWWLLPWLLFVCCLVGGALVYRISRRQPDRTTSHPNGAPDDVPQQR